jgi:hypothetical protein
MVTWSDTVESARNAITDTEWVLLRGDEGDEPTGIVATSLLADATEQSPIGDVLASRYDMVYAVDIDTVPRGAATDAAARVWRDLAESRGVWAVISSSSPVYGWPAEPKPLPPPQSRPPEPPPPPPAPSTPRQ